MLVVILESADAAHESTCTREEKVKVYDWEKSRCCMPQIPGCEHSTAFRIWEKTKSSCNKY